MGLISNMVDREMLKRGDHIYCYRKLHSYSHHGIYVGDNRVIHFTKTDEGDNAGTPTDDHHQRCTVCGYQRHTERGVVKSCVDCFLKGHRLHRFEYGVSSAHIFGKISGTSSTKCCSEPGVVVERATRVLDEGKGFGEYSFFKNNSESFAVYCTTGEAASAQATAAASKVKIAVEIISVVVEAALS